MVQIRLPAGNNGSGRDGNINFSSFIFINITDINGLQCTVCSQEYSLVSTKLGHFIPPCQVGGRQEAGSLGTTSWSRCISSTLAALRAAAPPASLCWKSKNTRGYPVSLPPSSPWLLTTSFSSTACWKTVAARWQAISLMSTFSGNVARLARSSSLMSSTRASAARLIMALVTTPVWPRAAPRARPGKMYLQQ